MTTCHFAARARAAGTCTPSPTSRCSQILNTAVCVLLVTGCRTTVRQIVRSINEHGGYWRHSMKTWFITGTSRGFGREWAIAALDRGDKVAATARKLGTIEPTGYSTDWSGSSARHATPLPAYDHIRDAAAKARAQRFTAPGNPEATRDAILTLADSDNPPLRLFLGESPLRIAVEDYGTPGWLPGRNGSRSPPTPARAPRASHT